MAEILYNLASGSSLVEYNVQRTSRPIYSLFPLPDILLIEAFECPCTVYSDTCHSGHRSRVNGQRLSKTLLCIRNSYLNFDTLTIPELRIYQLLILVHNSLHHEHRLPNDFANSFTLNSAIHVHNTPMIENLYLNSV